MPIDSFNGAFVLALLGTIGTAIAWWIKRADSREERMLKLVTEERDTARADAARARRDADRARAVALRWHTQLLQADITPVPGIDELGIGPGDGGAQ